MGISQYFVDFTMRQSEKLGELQYNLTSAYNRLNIGKEETGRFSGFIERSIPDERPKLRPLEGNDVPLKARKFEPFRPNTRIDLNLLTEVSLVAQGGFRSKVCYATKVL